MPHITVPSPDGREMPAYLSVPSSGRGPGVVVIQEIFGVNAWVRGVCDWYASKGFVAAAPELFWRIQPGAEFEASQAETARALRQQVKDDDASDDIAATIEYLRKHPNSTGRVGIVGFCWGGMLAYLAAAQYRPDAAVGYYGVSIEKRLDIAGNLSCPLMLHFGQLDKFTPPEVITQVREAFKEDPRVAIHEYDGANHAFARDGGASYNEAAAKLANSRTLALFDEKLKAR